jgi:TolB-like protein/DNA-binding winged helix-turn-helix (wHTH) protein/Flp pilus assembly protein TadD
MALDSISRPFLEEAGTEEMSSPEPEILIVGEFTLMLATGELECNGVRTRLQDKPFQVLRLLVEQPGELVTREMLFERLWPEGAYVEFEMGLNTAVRKLRTALRDDAEAPRYIETLPRRGYRLLASVTRATTRASGPSGLPRPVAVPSLQVPSGAAAPDQGLAPGGIDPIVGELVPATRPGLAPQAGSAATPAPESHAGDHVPVALRRSWRFIAAAALVLALAYLLAHQWSPSPRGALSRATTAALGQAAAARRELASGDEPSVAVLPFADMSEGKDQEYFSDGLSEELIERLGRTPGLRVIARTSSFYFKGRAERLETIASELRVANVLEGSVRKSGNRLRVTAQLIRAETNEHLWSETFDRDLHDVFSVQDEIASAVVTALRVHLVQSQAVTQEEPRTDNLEAYNQYLQGRQNYNQGDAAGYQRSVTAFRAATRLDPHYAAAYADLALAQFWLADGSSDLEGYKSALAAAEQAVALAPGMAAGYSARGFLRAVYRFDFAGAQADLNRAVALGPHDAMVLHRSAVLLGVLGDLPAAIAREEQALALDPLSEEMCRRLGFFFVADRQLAQARLLYERALAIAPNSDRAFNNLGDLQLLDNQPEQALASFRRTRIVEFSLAGQAKAEYSLGHLAASQRLLERLIREHGTTLAAVVAGVYAWRGEKDRAFEWAERAYAQRDPGITWVKISPDFRRLRDDPRYETLLRKMTLPE